jgi:uncharacterized protein DUF3455
MMRLSLLALLAFAAGCASPGRTRAPVVPAALRVPTPSVLIVRGRAVGAQIYVCQASAADPSHFDWTFKAPEAQLFDRSRPIIKHYAGPSWQANDGSVVVGEVVAKDDGPDAMAIPWLLLRAKSTSGEGLLSKTQFIQRLNTLGGKAPQGGCGPALVGSEVRVHYTADYLFYGPR